MLDGHGDLQPLPLRALPVERAAGLLPVTPALNERDEAEEPDSASLELEKNRLLSGHRGTVSEGVQPVTKPASHLNPQTTDASLCFADAQYALPKQHRRYYTAGMFCLVATLLSADQNLLAPNLTAVAKDFDFTDAERDKYLGGVISAAFFLLGAPAALLIGYLSDTMNRAKLLFWVVVLGKLAKVQLCLHA